MYSKYRVLIISCVICYVALPFNHTFKVDGFWTIVKLQ